MNRAGGNAVEQRALQVRTVKCDRGRPSFGQAHAIDWLSVGFEPVQFFYLACFLHEFCSETQLVENAHSVWPKCNCSADVEQLRRLLKYLGRKAQLAERQRRG